MIKNQHTLPFTLYFENEDREIETFKGRREQWKELLDHLEDGCNWGNYLDGLITEYGKETEKIPFEKFKEIVKKAKAKAAEEDDESDSSGLDSFCFDIEVDWSVSKEADGGKVLKGTVTWITEDPVPIVLDADAGDGLLEKFSLWFFDSLEEELVPIWYWGNAMSKVVS